MIYILNLQIQFDSEEQDLDINQMADEQEREKRRLTKIQAQTNAFTCLLVYFVVKAIVFLILYKYDNLLRREPIYLFPFVVLLIANVYLMLTAGNDPGFQPSLLQENELFLYERTNDNFCSICNCRRKNRSKHCYECGRCVRKYDHHCPWIGACVGQKNHFTFWVSLLVHTCVALLTFHILFESMKYYTYSLDDGSYSQEFGVFAIFSFFMLFYIAFAGGLLGFHTYLLVFNVTTRELVKRKKCTYLGKARGNPFSNGPYQNIKTAICIEESGRQWLVDKQRNSGQRSWVSKVWQNDYYSCC